MWYYLKHVDAAKVMQNEGYIQMSDVLSEHRHSAHAARRARRVPNADVHNGDVRRLLRQHGYVDSRT